MDHEVELGIELIALANRGRKIGSEAQFRELQKNFQELRELAEGNPGLAREVNHAHTRFMIIAVEGSGDQWGPPIQQAFQEFLGQEGLDIPETIRMSGELGARHANKIIMDSAEHSEETLMAAVEAAGRNRWTDMLQDAVNERCTKLQEHVTSNVLMATLEHIKQHLQLMVISVLVHN